MFPPKSQRLYLLWMSEFSLYTEFCIPRAILEISIDFLIIEQTNKSWVWRSFRVSLILPDFKTELHKIHIKRILTDILLYNSKHAHATISESNDTSHSAGFCSGYYAQVEEHTTSSWSHLVWSKAEIVLVVNNGSELDQMCVENSKVRVSPQWFK